ncbi:MAG: hypothetical protein KBD44_02820 [Candidatus Pacebacteria bacterium]|nr:hypothetical protein [Candidatus Paceibacterota bacterium]
MQGKDEISIFISFIIGFVGGFYFFLTGYAPYVEEVKETIFTPDQEVVESLIIVAKKYGGCEMLDRCGSYHLEYDGTYSYLPYSISQGATPEQGVLPRAMLSEVRSMTLPSKLRLASRTRAPEDCISYVDGIDYSYEIVRNGELFVLDTCTTTLSDYPELIDAFDLVWEYVSNQ